MIYINIKNNKKGFVALISAIIISVILLLIVTNLSLTGFYNRFNILDSELRERSVALAEACVDTAILKLTINSAYSPINETVSVGVDDCIIESVTGSPTKTILVKADYKDYITKLKVDINSTDMTIISWDEI